MTKVVQILNPRVLRSLRKRWTEWTLGYASFLIGALFLYNQTDIFSDYRYHDLDRVAPAIVWGSVFATLGLARLVVLYVNGLWSPGYAWRVVISILSLPLWYNLALLYWANESVVLMPGVVLTQIPIMLEGSSIVFAVHERFEDRLAKCDKGG